MSNYELLGAEAASMPAVTGAALPSLVDPAAIAAAESAKARIQAAYVMAMHKPRSFMASRARILDACKRPAFAGKVEYSKPVGGNKITGPSIRFAELALREWQNVMVETQTIYEDDEKRRVLVRVLDLETNAAFSKEIQINKTVERQNSTGREVVRERINSHGKPVYIVRATEDEILNKESATVSKAIRNEGLRLIPQDIIEEAMETARQTRMGQIKDPSAFIKQLCDAFSALRVSAADLEEYLGHAVESCSKIEIDDLQTIFNAIKDGEAKWSDFLPQKANGDKAKEGTASTADALKSKLKKAQGDEPKPHPKETPADEPAPSPAAVGSPMVECPKTGEDVSRDFECQRCPKRETECPQWVDIN